MTDQIYRGCNWLSCAYSAAYCVRMHRTQIQLEDGQWRAVNRVAGQRGVSAAQVIRDALERTLPAEVDQRRDRAVASIGGFRSGRGDVSVHHDDHLADAFAG